MQAHYNGANSAELATLATMLKNPANGVDDGMYQALAIAENLGIIESETRWDESLSRSEAIEMIISALEASPKKSDVENGVVDADKWLNENNARYTLTDLSETQLGYFQSIVELEKPVEYLQAMALSGEYVFITDESRLNKYGLDEELGKYNFRHLAMEYLDLDVVSSLRSPVKEYITLGLLPSNGVDLFREWFKQHPVYQECLDTIDQIYKDYEENLNKQPVDTQPSQGEETNTQTPEVTPQELNLIRYTTYNVRARTSPDQNSVYNGAIAAGTQVTVKAIDEETNWCKCEYNGSTVYILGDYLSETKPTVNKLPTQAGVTKNGDPVGKYIGSYGFALDSQGNLYVNDGWTNRIIDPSDPNYTLYIAETFLPPEENFDKGGDGDVMRGQLAALKEILSEDEYNELAERVEYAMGQANIYRVIKTDIRSIIALPDGSYVPTAGKRGEVVWVDPEYDWLYMAYDYHGLISSFCHFPEDHYMKGSLIKRQYVAFGFDPVESPRSLMEGYQTGIFCDPGEDNGSMSGIVEAKGASWIYVESEYQLDTDDVLDWKVPGWRDQQ